MGSPREGSGRVTRTPIPTVTEDVKALITDMDGTLVDLGINWDEVREKVRKEMGWDHPLRPLGVSITKVAKNEDEVKKAYSIVEREEYQAAFKAKRDEELVNLLSSLKRRGIKLALVTMQAYRSTEVVLKRLGLIDLFDVVITRDIVIGREEQLRIALEKLGVSPKEAVFVGDTPWDYESAKKLGIRFISVGTCYEKAPCVNNFKEIGEILM